MIYYDALVVGSTGRTGKALIECLLSSEKCKSVTSFGRSNLLFSSEKLNHHVGQHLSAKFYEKNSNLKNYKVAFCTLGTRVPHEDERENLIRQV